MFSSDRTSNTFPLNFKKNFPGILYQFFFLSLHSITGYPYPPSSFLKISSELSCNITISKCQSYEFKDKLHGDLYTLYFSTTQVLLSITSYLSYLFLQVLLNSSLTTSGGLYLLCQYRLNVRIKFLVDRTSFTQYSFEFKLVLLVVCTSCAYLDLEIKLTFSVVSPSFSFTKN